MAKRINKKLVSGNNPVIIILLVLLLLFGFGWGFGYMGGMMFFGPIFMVLILVLIAWLIVSLTQAGDKK